MPRTFNETELLDRIDQDREFLSEMVQMLSTDGRALLEKVHGAVAAGDAVLLARTAHTLKGMISNFYAKPAQTAALKLEIIGKAGNLSGAGEALDELEALIGAVIDELSEFAKAKS